VACSLLIQISFAIQFQCGDAGAQATHMSMTFEPVAFQCSCLSSRQYVYEIELAKLDFFFNDECFYYFKQ